MASETRHRNLTRTPGPNRPGLTRELVVAEALRLVDEQGVAALSMRKLGSRLGVEAMSLYTHVRNKDDLLNAIADRVGREIVLAPAPREDWQARVRNAVTAWVRVEEAHPGGFRLLYRNRIGTDEETSVNEEIMDALRTAGFPAAEVALIYQTLVYFLDTGLLFWPRSHWDAGEGWKAVERTINAALFPRMTEIAPLAALLTWDDVFWTGFDLFMLGLDQRLGSSRADSGGEIVSPNQ